MQIKSEILRYSLVQMHTFVGTSTHAITSADLYSAFLALHEFAAVDSLVEVPELVPSAMGAEAILPPLGGLGPDDSTENDGRDAQHHSQKRIGQHGNTPFRVRGSALPWRCPEIGRKSKV